METKPLLYGLVGFFIGGLLVATAAATINRPEQNEDNYSMMNSMSMGNMTASLRNKSGDKYDETFIANMIVHHEGAVAMAKLSAKNAKHEEIKTLSENIIVAQEKEIAEMKQWQTDWGYSSKTDHGSMMNY